MEITADMVKELRDETQAGVLDCKRALEDTDGDFDKAVELLREKGLAIAQKKAGREADEGLIESYIHTGGNVGALVEVNCETDFVARTDAFKALARDLAMQVVAVSPRFVTEEDIPEAFREQQMRIYREEARTDGKPEHIVDQIAEGRWNKHLSEIVLLKQPFIRDPDQAVGELITEKIAELKENIVVRRFTRFELGEASESE